MIKISQVPKNKRKKQPLKVLTDAEYLTSYTVQICSNTKIFIPKYQNSLTNKIIEKAQDIYIKAYAANEIRVVNELTWLERSQLQVVSIRLCNELLPLIQIAYRVFHLRASRIEYWGRLILDTRELLEKWHNSDKKRYKKFSIGNKPILTEFISLMPFLRDVG